MVRFRALVGLSALLAPALCEYKITLTPSSGLLITDGNTTVVNNSAILSGPQKSNVNPIKNTTSVLTYSLITPTIAKVVVNTTNAFHGARFSAPSTTHFYGVWEYPFNGNLDNENVSFDVKGVGSATGINWANARAPFFLTSAGYGVYTDTLKMGNYDFKAAGEAKFVFNSTNLVYYIILPKAEGDGLRSVIEQYTNLSARSEIPPTSGLGPTFWSDDFMQDFHGSVTNAAENVQDVVNHLYYNKIRATSSFADRPYGSGNRSWGNFDFDPKQYPDPKGFIANLTEWGFDFQVWIANRAQLGTKLFNESTKNGWLFPGVRPGGGLGEALNLSIPAAHKYFEDSLAYFPSVGVKGYKIDRGEEGEMPDYVQNEHMAIFTDLAYDTMVKKWGKSGFYTFARSAVDRSRAKTHIWNGDAHANFTGLAYSVTSGIRSGLIAFGIWGSDTGGYTREGGPLSPTPEVWARWMWFSTFSPVYEFMLGTGHTPWYPPYENTTVEIVKQTANLHADLTPYIKSYAYVNSKTGVPIIRALFLEAPKDGNVWQIPDSYFFGEQFLVAPIVTSGGSRSVYFPKGPSAKYLEYFDRKNVYEAGTTHNISAPLTSIPVFVKQGSIVPRGDIYQGNAKWIKDWKPSLRLELYPSWEVPVSKFTYYHGEGGVGDPVEIVLTANKEKKVIGVDLKHLGGVVVQEVVWYLKGEEKGRVVEVEGIADGDGMVWVSGVDTLF